MKGLDCNLDILEINRKWMYVQNAEVKFNKQNKMLKSFYSRIFIILEGGNNQFRIKFIYSEFIRSTASELIVYMITGASNGLYDLHLRLVQVILLLI